MMKEMELPFDLLCDTEKKVVNRYDLLNPYEHEGIARPAIFVIRPSGMIGYRSIDGTARRVDISDVLHYLDSLAENPEYRLDVRPKKHWIFPSWKAVRQIYRNMVHRGNSADWTHYVMTPVNPLIIPVKKITNKMRRPPKSSETDRDAKA